MEFSSSPSCYNSIFVFIFRGRATRFWQTYRGDIVSENIKIFAQCEDGNVIIPNTIFITKPIWVFRLATNSYISLTIRTLGIMLTNHNLYQCRMCVHCTVSSCNDSSATNYRSTTRGVTTVSFGKCNHPRKFILSSCDTTNNTVVTVSHATLTAIRST